MRVLHVVESLVGGPASYLKEVIPYQCREFGVENVTVVAPEQEASHLADLGIHVVTFSRKSRGVLSLVNLFFVLLRIIYQSEWSIIHAHGTFAGVLVRIFPKILSISRVKFVYCAHCWAFDRPFRGSMLYFYIFVERFLSCRTDLIINISPHESPLLLSHGFSLRNVITIQSGVSDSTLPQRAINLPRSARIKLLFVGRFDYQKGVDYLISRISELDMPYDLTVVGAPVRGDFIHSFPPGVKLLGWIDRDQVLDLMADSDFLLLSSRWEGMPLVVLEALRSSLPVISNKIPSIESIVSLLNVESEFPNGIFVIDFSLENSLKSMLSDISNRFDFFSLSHAARGNYLKFFTAEKMNSDIVGSYRELFVAGL